MGTQRTRVALSPRMDAVVPPVVHARGQPWRATVAPHLPDHQWLSGEVDTLEMQRLAGNQATLGLVRHTATLQRDGPTAATEPLTSSLPEPEPAASVASEDRATLRRWIAGWQSVMPGEAARPLPGGRSRNLSALAEALLQLRRQRAAGGSASGLRSTSESAPQIQALAGELVAETYDAMVAPEFDTLTSDEQSSVDKALDEGCLCGESLTGREETDLDILARRVFGGRTGVRPPSISTPGPDVLSTDLRYLALRTGPLQAAYRARTVRLSAALPGGDVIRGERGEPRAVAMRRIAWLYRRYGIPDWAAWYKANIVKKARFLDSTIVYGVHRDVADALKETEAELGFPGQYPAWRGGAIGGGYNVRGWGGKLGSHDFGMAIDLSHATNIEILGGHGWAGSQAGRDRLAVVTLLTPGYFSMREFARQSRARRVATSDQAAAAHAAIRTALGEEIKRVTDMDAKGSEQEWELHLENLLSSAGKLDEVPSILERLRSQRRLSGAAGRRAWISFLRGVEPLLVAREFFSLPPELVRALGKRFAWMPFHHFELPDWKARLKAR